MKRALIVVDYQRDFVTGSLGFPGAVALAERIAKKIAAYHKSGDVVLFTMDTHTDNYLNTQEGKHLPVPHCIKGTAGHTLVPEVAEQVEPQDLFFEKDTFGSTNLFVYLRTQQYASIELVGVVSSICVLSNAVLCKTALPEVPILVDSSCIAAPDPTLQEAAILMMKNLQMQILPEEETP